VSNGLATLLLFLETALMADTQTSLPATPAQNLPERDYTVRDLAQSKQCSARHIWRLIDAGRIPGVYRLGRLVRIHRATADAWFARGCK
jgi:excisionase family DNA binding protein